ncbi:hypothetical protein [Streptomyces sp. NPDC051219]|uniref:hypothetical protein n=1 Tax=Streptomyces sp. NPDC051219 TaxID=3155283 RepID=UPI0034445B61
MKYAKVAAIVAGSVVALGGATPAFAANSASIPPMSLNGALAETPLTTGTVMRAVEEQGSVVKSVADAAGGLKKVHDNAPSEVLKTTGAVAKSTPMLGGIDLGAQGGRG